MSNNNSIIVKNNELLLGSPKIKNNKFKKPSIIRLYKYLMIKLFSLISVLIMVIVNLLSALVLPLIFLLISQNSYNAINNIQYFILIFYSIFSFIFILFTSIRIFGNQVEDNSFLLIITKAYSRRKIILTQYLVIFSINLFLIIACCLIFFAIGSILVVNLKFNIFSFFSMMVLKFFIFLCLFSFLLISGVIFVVSLFSSKVAFLLFSIICSLFVLGSLPYNLFYSKINNISFTFENNSFLTYKKVDQAIKFEQYLNNKLFKYNLITSDINNFMLDNFNSKSFLNYFIDPTNITKRINFYKKSNIISTNSKDIKNQIKFNVYSWTKANLDNKDKPVNITINYTNDYPIKTISEMQQDINNNESTKFEKEFYQFCNDNINNAKKLYDNTSLVNNGLLSLNNIKISGIDKPPTKNLSDILFRTYLGEAGSLNSFNNIHFSSQKDQDNFNSIFEQPNYFLLICFEKSIYNIVNNYLELRDLSVNSDDQYQNYQSLINTYKILNKINFFEQWNQLWSSNLGIYGNFTFNLDFQNLDSDLNIEQNTFFSYPIFVLNLNDDNKINLDNLNYVQNQQVVIISYMILAIFLIVGTLVIWRYKNII